MGENPKSTASLLGHPIHPMLIPFPIVLFIGTLVCDAVYVIDGNRVYSVAATWLVGLGALTGLIAAAFGLIDVLYERRIRTIAAAWLHAGGNTLAVLISIYSFALRLQSGPPSQPTELVLSIIVVLILLATGWLGGELVFRHRVGVTGPDANSL